ncbi:MULTISPECIES: LPXTG cell wall anchor domain-containing protein [Streptacidiphilus]|uniref:LPXTG cell wall anchor domain-containing protein n=1 Tax=Streptacidiphilus cavernicola TaxID=3342716 RepID=A0ABV6USR0_9ACTN|nr:LPXTG cell wall anchor domain-containing protein [Streptacidiphilus jeojiense]
MSDPLLRRFARIGAAVVAASAISVGLALPAQADAGTGSAGGALISVLAPPAVTLVPQPASGGPTAFTTLTPIVANEGDVTQVDDVVLSVDATGLKGVAELSLPKGCSYTDAAQTKADCRLGSVAIVGTLDLGIRTLPGATVGTKAKLSFKATAANAVEDPSDSAESLTTEVTVGDGPDLATTQLGALTVKPGGSTGYTPQLRNLGDRDSDKGVVMLIDAASMSGGAGFSIGGNYSNCQYGVGDVEAPAAERTGVLCHFDDVVVHPGDVLQPSEPITVDATSAATRGYTEYGFDTVGGELTKGVSSGHAGTGAALTLVPVPSAGVRSRIADIDYTNNVGFAELSTGQSLDVAATGKDFSGTVGSSAHLYAGVVNKGTVPTQALEGAPSADDTVALLVALPEGIKVTKVPAGCERDDSESSGAVRSRVGNALSSRLTAAAGSLSEPDGSLYDCLVGSVVQPGASYTLDFTVEPTAVLHQAAGEVMAFTGDGIDDDMDNNVADFTVETVKGSTTPVTVTSTPTPTVSATATASASATPSAPATAATGGVLAATGGGDDTSPMLFFGVGAIALGVAAMLLTRRRRAGSHG